MDELKIHDNVFPFVCNKCNSEYDLEGFTNVIQLWGFIYLTKGEHNLIGITCPDCCCTTLRKFPSYTPDFSREALEKQGTSKRYLGKREHYVAPDIKYFVPFSPKILASLSLVSLPNFQEDDNKGNSYRIPDGFEQIMYTYPQHISEEFPYSFEESNIPVLCDIENNEKFKVFPRIIGRRLIYFYSNIDKILSNLDPSGEILSEGMEEINKALCSLIEFNYHTKFRPHPKDPKIFFDHMIQNDMSEDEYENMALYDQAWEREAFQENVHEFIKEYKVLRNRIDFELICNNELINKFARIFYYEPNFSNVGALRESQALSDAIEADDSWIDKGRMLDQIHALTEPSNGDKKPMPVSGLTSPILSKEEYKIDEPSLAALIEKENPLLEDKENVFKLVDSNWYIKFKGVATILFNNKKIRYVVHLLERPGMHVNNMDLVCEFKFKKEESSDVEENLKKGQKKIMTETVNEFLAKLEKAQNINDKEQIKEIKQEINRIRTILKEVYNAELTIKKNKATIKGKEEILRKKAKNARTTVRNNLNNAYIAIEKDLPKLERHLIQCIDTRTTYAVYDPEKAKTDKSVSWHISW